MKVTFVEDCTVYPDGAKPVSVRQGQSLELSDDYAALMIKKGHAVDATAPAKKQEKA